MTDRKSGDDVVGVTANVTEESDDNDSGHQIGP